MINGAKQLRPERLNMPGGLINKSYIEYLDSPT